MTIQELNVKILPNPASDAPTRISMIARKDFRDRFESEKANHEKLFSDLFGGQWSIQLDQANLFTYTSQKEEGTFGYYCEKFFGSPQNQDNLKNYIVNHGEDGKKELNGLAYNHVVTIEPSTEEGLDFQDGKFRILFGPDGFTHASSYWSQNLVKDIAKAKAKIESSGHAKPEMSIIAKKDIRDRYEAEVQPYLERARKYLQCPELEFVPNFEKNYAFYSAWEAELRANPDERAVREMEKDWQGLIGYLTLKYFQSFTDWLQNNGFANDDMLQEGFKEAVSQSKISLLQVEDSVPAESSKGYSGDSVIEDGILVLRTNRKNFGWNQGDCFKSIMGLL